VTGGPAAASPARLRTRAQIVKDTVTFPLRALTLFEHDRFGLSSLRTERFDYVAREVRGECLDVGCGRHNLFVTEWLGGRGRGIDVYAYDGLTADHLVDSLETFPFPDESFETVTFIANLNHVPRSLRDVELAEAYRVLRRGGNIVLTMGHPLAEILVHRLVRFYDRVLGTSIDVDTERGMGEEEEFYLLDAEILERLARAGFRDVRKRRFGSQWGLNHLFVAWKRDAAQSPR